MSNMFEKFVPMVHREGLTTAEMDFVQNIAGLSYQTGDILYYNGLDLTVLHRGSNSQVLTLASGLPSWADAAVGGGGSGTVTSVSVVTANGVSGTVATETTTPAITLTLGAITPSSVNVSGLTASEIVITDGSKNLVSAAVATYPSLTELTYLKGVTSAIQTQLNSKAATLSGTINEIAYFNSSSTIASLAVATYPSLTELTYVKGVTSAIQTQLGTKQATITFGTGVETALGVNIGSAGAPVLFNGALGTPSSGTGTNITGIPAANILAGSFGAGAYVISTSLQVATIELGHATDTTLARVSAGVVSIEGVNILTVAGGTLTGNITLGENTSIALDPAGSADGKYTGITVTGTAGEALAFGDVIVIDVTAGKWFKGSVSAAAGADGDLRGGTGMCVLAAAGDASATTILLSGTCRADANFPALTIGSVVYATTLGDITLTQPVTVDHIIKVLGFALSADEIMFCPSMDYMTHT